MTPPIRSAQLHAPGHVGPVLALVVATLLCAQPHGASAAVAGPAPPPVQGGEGHGPEPVTAQVAHEAARDAAAGAAEHEGEFDIVHHLGDSHTLDFEPFGEIELPRLELLGIDLSITKHVVFLWLAAALMLAIFIPMARQRGPVRRGLGNFFEAFVVYLRDEVAEGNIGKEEAARYVPYLLTLLFFIFFANLLGLLPFGATATSNWIVTGTLGLVSFAVAETSSLAKLGPRGFAKQFVPVHLESGGIVGKLFGLGIAGLLFVIEVISHLIRPFTLMIRLAANMIAGHTVILALLGLIFILNTYFVAPFSIAGAAAVYLLEIFIALVQAFIFTFLTSLYIGMALHPH
ncbi:MAG: F0F1 ATP synthase subunit A [Gemmatimonadota bacterium]